MVKMDKKVKTARLSIISNTFLICMKVVAGLWSGSVSILSEAIHSGMDLLAALIAFFSVKRSDNPPDKKHPYGHGKFENISGVIEAILIFLAALLIIFESVRKFMNPTDVEKLGIGASVMAISSAVNLIVSRRLYKVARESDSIALEADALHLATDVYTSVGVAVGLILIWITGWHFLDPAVAILVAMLILKESYKLLKNAFYPLVDTSLSDEENRIISEEISKMKLGYHDLRTRKAGQYRFADLHLELPADFNLELIHQICDELETAIKRRLKNIELNIHVEPFEENVSKIR